MSQLIAYYSGIDLKIVIFTDEENAKEWEYLKYLPHLKSNDSDVRFFATNEDEMKQVSSYLENVFTDRNNKIKTWGNVLLIIPFEDQPRITHK